LSFPAGGVHAAPSVDKVADETTAAERQTVEIAELHEEIAEKGAINQPGRCRQPKCLRLREAPMQSSSKYEVVSTLDRATTSRLSA
jgi:hypothetical protein